jgi:hypothetical protein
MSEQTFINKPEVHYKGPLRITEWWMSEPDAPREYVAHLDLVLNHPRLGVCPNVRTSTIKVWPDDKGNFETRNTKYIRVYAASEAN